MQTLNILAARAFILAFVVADTLLLFNLMIPAG